MVTEFLPPNFDNMPKEAKCLPRWVSWKYEPREPGAEPGKIPYNPKRPNTRASSTDPATWGTFDQARAAYLGGNRTGVGIVLDGDGMVGVDIDHCVVDGKPTPKAMALLDKLEAAYIEVSPSGTGLRAIGYGEQLDAGVNGVLDGLHVEFYSTGRYLTLTGMTIKAGPIAPLKNFKTIAESYRAAKKTKTNEKTGQSEDVPPDERYAALVAAILSGAVYHDSLRDLAASMVAAGMQPGAVVNHLRGLMDASQGAHDDRWRARRAQIPDLVTSAAVKFKPTGKYFESVDPETGETVKVHPLARFVDVGGTPKPPRWVIPGFVGHGVTVISGAAGVGKTTAILPLSMTAAGLHGGDMMPCEWRHVVYVTEDLEQAQRILAGIVEHGDLNISWEQVRERLHIVEAVRLDPAFVAQVGKTYREQFTRTVEGVEVLPLVVLDTKSAVLALDNENDNSEASRMMAALKQGFEGLPVWLVGHVAKTSIGRSDVATLTSRGAGATEGDGNQTMFLVLEGDSRFLVLGKVRFEPRWRELAITAHTASVFAQDEFGNPEEVTMRWGIAGPAQQSRKEASELAAEQRREESDAALRQEVIVAVDIAWFVGNPLNRAGVKSEVRRKATDVVAMVETLLAESWLYEVTVPSKLRLVNSRGAFLVSLTQQEREAVLRGGSIPADKLEIPASWCKTSIPPVPAKNSSLGAGQ